MYVCMYVCMFLLFIVCFGRQLDGVYEEQVEGTVHREPLMQLICCGTPPRATAGGGLPTTMYKTVLVAR